MFKVIRNFWPTLMAALKESKERVPAKGIEGVLQQNDEAIDNVKALNKFVFLISAGALVAFLNFLANIDNNHAIVSVGSLKWPMLMLVLSLLTCLFSEIFFSWFKTSKYLVNSGPNQKMLRLYYYLFGGVCGWISGILLIVSLFWFSIVLTSV